MKPTRPFLRTLAARASAGMFALIAWAAMERSSFGQSSPVITSQPQSVSVDAGASVTLAVSATDAASYQWQIGSPGQELDIPGQTSATLSLTNICLADVGKEFRVVVRNAYGSTASQRAMIFLNGTLFLEAEDANFNHGQWEQNSPIGMTGPYSGGSYFNLGSADDADIDWHAEGPNGQPYRPATGVSAGKLNQHSDGQTRGSFDVTANYTLGWNNSGDWYNYTREWPSPAADYNLIGRLASGGAPINVELDLVTSDPSQPDQTVQKLGAFNPSRATPGGWDEMETFPLTDDNGNLVKVNLGGLNTIRLTILPDSNEDIDYLMFVPASGVPPPAPPRVQNPRAIASYAAVALAWDPSSVPNWGILYYDLERNGVIVARGIRDPYYTDIDGIAPQTTYTYRVFARNNSLSISSLSEPVTVTTTSALPGPQFGPGGHYYEIALLDPTSGAPITWNQALAQSSTFSFHCVSGHLATITSESEDMFIEALRKSVVTQLGLLPDNTQHPHEFWVGGFQAPESGEPAGGWEWINYEGLIPATPYGGSRSGINAPAAPFTFWAQNEPNDCNSHIALSPGREDQLAIGRHGTRGWNDEGCAVKQIWGYVIEYEPLPLVCPPDITICNDPGQCGAIVHYTPPALPAGCYELSVQCSPASGSFFPVGTTKIKCVAVDGNEQIVSACAINVIVRDCEAPVITSVPTTNSAGSTVPPAGASSSDGQNPDGFYQLFARDNCDGTNLQIFVKDSAEGPCGGVFRAGPYAPGTKVKLTQSPGQAGVKPMAGTIAAHINTRGNPVVVVTDSAGNTACQVCRAPPAGK